MFSGTTILSQPTAAKPLERPFSEHLIQAIERVEAAHAASHLLYASEYCHKHPDLTLNDKTMTSFGLTTHTNLFLQYSSSNNPLMSFRLKPHVSASKAIQTMLTSGETVVDCGSALVIVYLLATLIAFEAYHGKEQGQGRFDLVFGSDKIEVPAAQRLLITNNGVASGTAESELIQTNLYEMPREALNVMSYYFGFTHIAKFENQYKGREILKTFPLREGSLLGVHGSEDYFAKHPVGEQGSYNGIYRGIQDNQILLYVFGHGKTPLKENEIVDRIITAYNKDADELNLYARTKMFSLTGSFKSKIQKKDIHGLMLAGNIDIIDKAWESLLKDPIMDVVNNIRNHLREKLALRKRYYAPEIEDKEDLPVFSNRHQYHIPKSLSQEIILSLLKTHNAKLIKKTEEDVVIELESSHLNADFRKKLEIERKGMRYLSSATINSLKTQFPCLTIEKDLLVDRWLLTAPKRIYKNLETQLENKLPAVEGKEKATESSFAPGAK